MVDDRADLHVRLQALVDGPGVGQLGAAGPLLEHPRVAGVGQRPRAEVGADEQGVTVPPRHVALGLRQREPVLDEPLRRGVELADDRGVGPAPRQRDEAAVVGRLQEVRPVPDPVLLLLVGEFVQVEDRLPPRVGLAVLLHAETG